MNTPKPNTQMLSWFFAEEKKGTLDLSPKYQRNPIWSPGQRCFLIDSLVSGCPIPQVYLNVCVSGTGMQRKTVFEVVDGQQRLRTILDFMNDRFKLVKIPSSYPVSSAYASLLGKKYSELPRELQEGIWDYPLAVQELRGLNPDQIRALFRRLNYVNERLTKQEMRHSQYFGDFVSVVERLAALPVWDDMEVFTRRDSQRMRDIEFVSELLVLLMHGPQDQQKTLDKYYAEYDIELPRKQYWVRHFHFALDSIRHVARMVSSSRFSKKADFYGLFGAIAERVKQEHSAMDPSAAVTSLSRLDEELRRPTAEMRGTYADYYATVAEGSNKLAKRQRRIQILTDLLPRAGRR